MVGEPERLVRGAQHLLARGLAKRDAEWMGPLFEFHGLTIDVIDKHDSHSPGRRAAYGADITYGTNNEFGFDYLRDNSFVVEPEQPGLRARLDQAAE